MPWRGPGGCTESRRPSSCAEGRFGTCPFVSLRRHANQASIVALHEAAGTMNPVACLGPKYAVGMPGLRDPSDSKNGLSDVPVRGACKCGVERLERAHMRHRGTRGAYCGDAD